MAFVKFTETGKSFIAKASISAHGMVGFNDGARRKFKMDDYDYCIMYYDEAERYIGIELTQDKAVTGAMKLRKGNSGASIGARSFLNYFEIAPDKTTRYEIKAGEEENFLIIDLNTGKERKRKSEN